MSTVTENILNVTLIEPRFKHSTIFAEFDKLKGGEDLIIHNDHDPKPLYYQLLNDKGETFSWEYLEQGPEWWKIKISKFKTDADKDINTTNDENILNVTLLEPRRKHPTIFEHFDALQGGESFIILNDHNPKPLYYQMLGERGNIFKWEYLEQGPEWWRIKITKNKEGESNETLGEIATKDLRKAQIFKKYGLDFCCGGKKTIKEACEEKGIDSKQVEQELEKANGSYNARPLPYNDWSIDFLADYIINTHHSYLNKVLPDIRSYAAKVYQVHGANHPELEQVHKLVEAVGNELVEHMKEEEDLYFPYIKHLVSVKKSAMFYKKPSFGSIHDTFEKIENEHKSVGEKLEQIREITNNYTLPSDACASYTLLFKMLDEVEDDVHTHIHLENNILFPKAVDLERSCY